MGTPDGQQPTKPHQALAGFPWRVFASVMILLAIIGLFCGIASAIWDPSQDRVGRSIPIINRVTAAIIGALLCKAMVIGVASWGRPSWLSRNTFVFAFGSIGPMMVGANSGSVGLAAFCGTMIGLVFGLYHRLASRGSPEDEAPAVAVPSALTSHSLWDRTLDG